MTSSSDAPQVEVTFEEVRLRVCAPLRSARSHAQGRRCAKRQRLAARRMRVLWARAYSAEPAWPA
jgi:hypothetical protein